MVSMVVLSTASGDACRAQEQSAHTVLITCMFEAMRSAVLVIMGGRDHTHGFQTNCQFVVV
jgi:hypothetical protein